MIDRQSLYLARDSSFKESVAQKVRTHLLDLRANRSNIITRWVWELLQNARDASIGDGTQLVASFEVDGTGIVFQHNGRDFKNEEVVRLIYPGSTKAEDEVAIGQYGSGFLTTHLLSSEINISGRLDGQTFDFPLKREKNASIRELIDSMDNAWEAFEASLGNANTLSQSDFTTQFCYPLMDEDASDAVTAGIATLKLCAPFVMIFNEEFSSIKIKLPDEIVRFKVNGRADLQDGLKEVSVEGESEGSARKITKYLVAQKGKTSVAIPFKSDGGVQTCLELKDVSKLFLGFPLVGTEDFSFPFVINSLAFTPTEQRNGVYLWKNESDEANLSNQRVIEESCELLTNIVGFAASSGWRNVYRLADIPAISRYDWLDGEQLQQCLESRLVTPIRQTPAVLGEQRDESIAPECAILPIAESEEGVTSLWDLLNDLKDFRPKLPRRDEAPGWSKAVKNWAAIKGCAPDSMREAFDGHKLAEHIESDSGGTLDGLQGMLKEDVCAVKWLDRMYAFLRENGFDSEFSSRRIVLDQIGCLDELSNLYRDKDIHNELKRISDDVLNLEVRDYLRDVRITSLNDEAGKGDYENKDVADRIIAELKRCAGNENLSDEFADAGVRLLAWVVNAEQWDWLDDFPAFSLRRDGNRAVLRLNRAGASESDTPLAPVSAWPEDLRQYATIFPSTRILADKFYDAIPDESAWQKLAKAGCVRLNVVTTRLTKVNKSLLEHLLDDEENHRTTDEISVTDIVGRADIMDQVRDSRRSAFLLWRFLTEWLVKEDVHGLSVKEVECECGDTHSYYQAAWLEPLRESAWIRLSNSSRRLRASANSLAELLRDNGWDPRNLNENPHAIKLLEAIGVSRFDLMKETIEVIPGEMDDKLINIMTAAGGNPKNLDKVPQILEQLDAAPELSQILEQMKDDPALTDYLAERRQQRQTVHRNQRLGTLVEDLVKENLEQEGFEVSRTHVGADLIVRRTAVERDEQEEIMTLALAKQDQRWEVEVKATRDNDVRMTPAQAKNAIKLESGFLLCVVPIKGEDAPDVDYVRDRMRFVEGMGERVGPLYQDLGKFERQRRDIIVGDVYGVKLELMSGNPRFSVDSSVWEDDGFELGELAGRLDAGSGGKGK